MLSRTPSEYRVCATTRGSRRNQSNMCVRDLPRGRCRVSRRTSSSAAAKLRKFENYVSLFRSSKRACRRKREEDVDLFCSELLAQGDSQSYHSDISYLKIEGEPLSPLMVDIPSPLSAAVDPDVYSSLLMLPDDCNYFQQRSWTGAERVPSPFGYPEEIALGPETDHNRAGDVGRWSDDGLIDGVVWRDFSPEQSPSVPVAMYDLWECLEAATCLPFGNSLQSNNLPCEQWASKACEPLWDDKERRSTESIASSRSRKKLEFSVDDETLNSHISTISQKKAHSTCDREITGVTNNSRCTLEFREAMELLLEKESASNYQLSKVYVERLTRNSGQKLEINNISSIRREFVMWIFRVVEQLQLISLTAAHAVSLFDRILSQRISLDAQVEDNDELLLSATACVWIAAKLEDSSVPHLSSIQALVTVGFDDVKFRNIEVVVLSSLGWRTLGATASEYLSNMISQLPELGVPAHLLTSLGCRSEEVMRVLLPEVEFLAYQPSVVSFSVMQCLLDEFVPVQTASLMAAFHLALTVDVESKEDCNRALKNLVKPIQASVLQSPPLGCADFKICNDLQSDSSSADTLMDYGTSLPISAY